MSSSHGADGGGDHHHRRGIDSYSSTRGANIALVANVAKAFQGAHYGRFRHRPGCRGLRPVAANASCLIIGESHVVNGVRK